MRSLLVHHYIGRGREIDSTAGPDTVELSFRACHLPRLAFAQNIQILQAKQMDGIIEEYEAESEDSRFQSDFAAKDHGGCACRNTGKTS